MSPSHTRLSLFTIFCTRRWDSRNTIRRLRPSRSPIGWQRLLSKRVLCALSVSLDYRVVIKTSANCFFPPEDFLSCSHVLFDLIGLLRMTSKMKFVRSLMKAAALANVPKHIDHFSKFSPSPLSMKQFLDFGECDLSITTEFDAVVHIQTTFLWHISRFKFQMIWNENIF